MKSLLVKATFVERPDSDCIHRFRNFGEEAWKELKEETGISIDEIDSCTSSFKVLGIKAKRLGRAKQVLRNLIESHGLTGDVEIREGS